MITTRVFKATSLMRVITVSWMQKCCEQRHSTYILISQICFCSPYHIFLYITFCLVYCYIFPLLAKIPIDMRSELLLYNEKIL